MEFVGMVGKELKVIIEIIIFDTVGYHPENMEN